MNPTRIETKIALGFLLMFNLFSASAQIGVEDKRNAYNNRRFYARTARLCENSVLIQLAQIPNALRLTYERRLDYRFVVGANASLRFVGEEAGTVKSEVFGKFFVNKRAPQGLYVYADLGFAAVRNHTFDYKMNFDEAESTKIANPKIQQLITRSASFTSLTSGFGFGFQNVYGAGRRTVIDIAIGYRNYQIPSKVSSGTVVENGLRYNAFNNNNTLLSTISPLAFRFGMGYMF